MAILLSSGMRSLAPPIEPNLAKANLCGTCQQRLRRAVDAAREPQSQTSRAVTADFRRHRSIRATIQESNARAASRSASIAVPMPTSNNSQLPEKSQASSGSTPANNNTSQSQTQAPRDTQPAEKGEHYQRNEQPSPIASQNFLPPAVQQPPPPGQTNSLLPDSLRRVECTALAGANRKYNYR
ncbi:hypothetical protein EV179_003874 [Coemansia sp. RSA 487]|nr:hypothetical protein LPJ74_000100 [Coemansia sp. RSA 1843]KAJ2092607.1 hypothetical protein IW138_001045 [Coemansia sp. RSA 986]KAJ2213365.1 hypothetical protein EV179_003874 [Coemansia sp. RSA 487]